MKMERDLHTIKGDGDSSYTKNSSIQRKAILATEPMVEKAIRGLRTDLQPRSMVVADLGCSSGANTLLFVSKVIATISEDSPTDSNIRECPMELQFFLNDLPSNDFNHTFQSLEQFKQLTAQDYARRGLQPPPHYFAAVAGSFYTELFPCSSVHLFHSSFSLMWLSQVPEHLHSNMNKGNIHIGVTTSPLAAKLYLDEFEKGFSHFLQLRCRELVPGGRMVLTILGRKNDDMIFGGGTLSSTLELLSQAMRTLIEEGRVEEEKLDTFNLPIYSPSPDELKRLVEQSHLLDIMDTQVFDLPYDPMDQNYSKPDQEGAAAADDAHEAIGRKIAAGLRAVTEPLLACHFGESIIDELFAVFACNMTRQLESGGEGRAVTVISMLLQAKVLQ
ncbi:anthranilate O-methyltransferase 1-like [Oryza brachyantha]|nr:anthranilate O-methyltransferase 1-like [Oryza brachyantha]